MGPIFNEKVAEKWTLWDLWTVHVWTVHSWQSQLLRAEKKKKKEKNAEEKRNATFIAIQTVTQQNNEHPWFYVNLQAWKSTFWHIVVHIKCTINHVQIQIGQKLEEYKLLACPHEVREQLSIEHWLQSKFEQKNFILLTL